MSNLDLYEKIRAVPAEAQKKITGGRLNGKTDINPMWRLKTLTEQFGICGIGWKYVINKMWLENGVNDEIAAFVEIDLFIKQGGEWSEGIPGIGGSAFVAKEKNGLYVSDECYKMALTDALSVSCKALGMGADVYWEKDSNKYDKSPLEQPEPTPPAAIKIYKCEGCSGEIKGVKLPNGQEITAAEVAEKAAHAYGVNLCWDCSVRRKQEVGNGQ